MDNEDSASAAFQGDRMLGGFDCRLLRENDVDEAVALMQRTGVHFAGTRSSRVLHAVAQDAVRHPRSVRIALAISSGGPVGIVVSFIQRAHYWRRFVARHPAAALELGAHRLVRTVRRHVGHRDVAPSPSARAAEARRLVEDRLVTGGAERWSDESNSIVKVMYVAVDPSHRKGRVGTKLYRWFFRDLHAAGFDRCDACVSSENVAALTLHRRFPFRFVDMHGGYFLWLLPREVAPE